MSTLRFRPSICATAWLAAILLVSSGSAAGAEGEPADDPRPNIVFFLVDDLGWMDTSVYGSRYYETPSLERLAAAGMVFTDAYSASPNCSPTRASILTGKHPARLGFTNAAGHLNPLPPHAPRYPAEAKSFMKTLSPVSQRFLPLSEVTLAEALREAGYRTAHIGKWHVGNRPEHWPQAQGFDVVRHGTPEGPRSFLSPYLFDAGNLTDGPEGEYLTDRLTDEALDFIEASQDQPFLLHLWHFGVHGPWGHKEQLTRRYAGREDPRGKQNNPIMASMIQSVDESLGRVLDKLDELELTEQTILVFYSDNGGDVANRIGPNRLPPTSNFPLRGGKGWLYEGGIRVPLVVSWPGVVEPGSRTDTVVSSVDFFPTLLEMAGRPAPDPEAIDGESLVPVLEGGRLERKAIYFFYPHGGGPRPPASAVRSGRWKLVRWFETNPYFPDHLELYDLTEDLGESTNLARAEPEQARRLDALLSDFLVQTEAPLPKLNPAWDAELTTLGGWMVTGSQFALGEGMLTLQGEDASPFLAYGRMVPPGGLPERASGSLRFSLRARSKNLRAGRLMWGTRNEKQDYSKQVAAVALPQDGQWHQLEVPLKVDGELNGFRLWVPDRDGTIEIDWIQLEDLAASSGSGPRLLRKWTFDLDPPRLSNRLSESKAPDRLPVEPESPTQDET